MKVNGLAEALAAVGAGLPRRSRRLTAGHIHGTWVVTTSLGRFVAQRLNATVFPDLEACDRNLVRIGDHLANVEGIDVPEFLRDGHGRCQVTDGDGGVWRVSTYAAGTRAASAVRSAVAANRAAEAFGRYVAALADLPGPPLADTIDRFHDLPWRLAQFEGAVAADRVGRLADCESDVAAMREAAHEVFQRLASLPVLPIRAVHNDAKIGNLRFRLGGGSPLVLDLDTTMPGLAIFDVGELLRSASHRGLEDQQHEHGRVVVPEFAAAIIEGFTAGMGTLLTTAERAAMVPAAPLMAIENGVRMLADHLDGDRYFRTNRPNHNLVRSRAQHRVALDLFTL